ncbi:MAG: ATP-binding protein [Actinobacteria bacterium]|nr:ATP-binding protein [Actinomycetota bacterium]
MTRHSSGASALQSGDAGTERTLPMGVDNIGFMLERLGSDCDDLQFLRELTKNSIDAESSQIIWDVDWNLWEASEGRLYKLCCIDNGRGMDGNEMIRYINQLSSSIHSQSHDGNYGVGAKIAAATRNPAGLIYQSWTDGRGSMIQLWKDPRSGDYGLRQFEREDGTFGYWQPIGGPSMLDTDALKVSDIIREHGTRVVLLGTGDAHNTIEPPEGAGIPSRWVNRYLSTRYFRFPKGIEVKTREGWKAEPDSKSNLLRGVRGQGAYLDANSVDHGVARLPQCKAHWWILKTREERQEAPELITTGHFAALYRDELYELRTARGGMALLQQFGVLFGHDRVVLYVEPTNGDSARITSNTARTQLLRDNQSLPYADWAADFRDAMPAQIRNHVDSVIAGSGSDSHQDSIKERLNNYEKLYRLSRYRPRRGGSFAMEEPMLGRRRSRRQRNKEDGGETGRSRGKHSDTAGSLLASMLAEEGRSAEEASKGLAIPSTQWISLEDGTRAEGEIEDRAAKFLREDNLIKINADFRGFGDMVDYWCDQRGVDRGHQAIVDIVHEWFEQALIETVMGCQDLQGAQHWDPDELDRALSEESLTAAVMQRYHVANAIKRAIGARMGSFRTEEEVAVEAAR